MKKFNVKTVQKIARILLFITGLIQSILLICVKNYYSDTLSIIFIVLCFAVGILGLMEKVSDN